MLRAYDLFTPHVNCHPERGCRSRSERRRSRRTPVPGACSSKPSRHSHCAHEKHRVNAWPRHRSPTLYWGPLGFARGRLFDSASFASRTLAQDDNFTRTMKKVTASERSESPMQFARGGELHESSHRSMTSHMRIRESRAQGKLGKPRPTRAVLL